MITKQFALIVLDDEIKHLDLSLMMPGHHKHENAALMQRRRNFSDVRELIASLPEPQLSYPGRAPYIDADGRGHDAPFTPAPIKTLLAAVRSALDWRGLDGDGISDPCRQQLRAVLSDYDDPSSAPDQEIA